MLGHLVWKKLPTQDLELHFEAYTSIAPGLKSLGTLVFSKWKFLLSKIVSFMQFEWKTKWVKSPSPSVLALWKFQIGPNQDALFWYFWKLYVFLVPFPHKTSETQKFLMQWYFVAMYLLEDRLFTSFAVRSFHIKSFPNLKS